MSQSILVNKRPMMDEAEASPVADAKRPRIMNGTFLSEHVGATELVSAFALASLASMGSRDQKDEREEQTESREEMIEGDSPTYSTSLEVRSPVRANKKVTFSQDTRNINRETSRRLSLPPRVKHSTGPRLPPVFVRGNAFARHSHPGQQVIPMRRHGPQPWLRPRHVAHRPTNAPPPPPPPPPPRAQAPPTDKWICDYCNVAAFDTYQEACQHEESCKLRFSSHSRKVSPAWHMPHSRIMYPQSSPAPPPPPSIMYPPSRRPSSGEPPLCRPTFVEQRTWFTGTVSLALRDSDADWLSALNCFIRESCVEAFSATFQDVSATTKRGRIAPHQVGIRCCFCKSRPRDQLHVAAISYPVSVGGIYESVKRWQKVHVEVCQDMPVEAKEKLQELSSGNSWIPTTRQYWADSARSMGMVDTQDGIRFAKDPAQITARAITVSGSGMVQETPPEARNDEESEPVNSEHLSDGDNIVFPEDMAMVPPYVYFLIRQVEATHFTEADRFVARSKGPIGYPGFQCRHCRGHAGLGKYFPVSAKSLSTNSTSQNIHSHLLKCRKVNPYVKDQLMTLKEEKSKAPRLEPGWRRIFFDKIWSRLHGE